ncbi:PREDICTED: RNA-binding protein 12B [Nanorana parkeri]|uniref:RNA-binding protein 12B n=1 Tax=Nanorana parkeri TaxID=125878 RepID=UPI00085427D5|nr:PREDICTED: RNA-binding protein 12B [Nanorana parkeri]XP_018415693.1 PREDICTED: RNA-binding protein 12B [Nanorana parkeri]XP_018415694.1 PREDICTED: RNA-binding protein 12B [Nanorana parkeri]
MAVVIRLEGLPVVAGSVDIRHFFSGLNIPDGGVHIIGGKTGKAFIIFATDEDARRAMSRTGGGVKNSRVQLFLSSKTEMQNTLEMSRRGNRKHPAVPPGSDTFGAKKGVDYNKKFDKGIIEPGLDNSGIKHNEVYTGRYDRREAKPSKEPDDVYVFMYGLPYSATEEEVRKFFSGIDVVEVLFLLRPNGLRNGNGLVKFGSAKDASAALERHNQYIGDRFISLKKTTEEQWVTAGGQVGVPHSKQPRKRRSRSRSPQNQQFYVHLKNLSYSVEKEDIKRFLGFPDLPDSQIKFLLDRHQNRTREGFVMVRNGWQFEKCITLHKGNLGGRPIFILPIPRKEMLDLIESFESRSPPKVESFIGDCPSRERSPTKRCIYLRNFPFDVTKAEVLRFLAGFPVHEDDIYLLFDNNGVGLGEALVKFPTEQQALLAESLNRQRFLDTEVLLRRISDEQMKEFGVFIEKPVENVLARSPMYRDEYSARERSYGLHDDLAYGHRDFRGSPERFRGSNSLDFVGPDEFAGRFDRGSQNNIDYHHSIPYRSQSLEGRPAGAIVRMKNLPYKATMEEILDFFYGYRVTRDSVDVKFTKDGMATGLATVYFENYDEAMAAVNELNERPIGTRKILLSLTEN